VGGGLEILMLKGGIEYFSSPLRKSEKSRFWCRRKESKRRIRVKRSWTRNTTGRCFAFLYTGDVSAFPKLTPPIMQKYHK